MANNVSFNFTQGKDGRDGKDFTSLSLLRGVINETVAKGKFLWLDTWLAQDLSHIDSIGGTQKYCFWVFSPKTMQKQQNVLLEIEVYLCYAKSLIHLKWAATFVCICILPQDSTSSVKHFRMETAFLEPTYIQWCELHFVGAQQLSAKVKTHLQRTNSW